jgi:NAD-specific glutamate dehydrogenase
VLIAAKTGATLDMVGRALYASAADLGIDKLILEGSKLAAKDFVERQAINRLLTQVFSSHRALVAQAVTEPQEIAAYRPGRTAWRSLPQDANRPCGVARRQQNTLARLTVAQA